MKSRNLKQFCIEFQYVSDFYFKRVPYHKKHILYYEGLRKNKKIENVGGGTFPYGEGIVYFSRKGSDY